MSPKIIHITTSLATGGAEMMLARLLAHGNSSRFDPIVISLSGGGPIGEDIARLGVPIHTIGMTPGRPSIVALTRLVRVLHRERPAVVQTWQYHADLIGGLAARMTGNPALVWGIHQGTLDRNLMKRSTWQVMRTCARTSYVLPAAIVCCAETALEAHQRVGYARHKLLVIPNGFDMNVHRADPTVRHAIRAELGLLPETPLIGLIARFHAQKDHQTFIRAAGELHQKRHDVHFVLCGRDITLDNQTLQRWIEEAGITDRCHVLGERRDAGRIQAALDIACLSSVGGEAFPLVLGEAMACGVPCVATNVGDSARLVGDAGYIVPIANPGALADACQTILNLSPSARARLGLKARQRIETNFALPSIVARYESLHSGLADGQRFSMGWVP